MMRIDAIKVLYLPVGYFIFTITNKVRTDLKLSNWCFTLLFLETIFQVRTCVGE